MGNMNRQERARYLIGEALLRYVESFDNSVEAFETPAMLFLGQCIGENLTGEERNLLIDQTGWNAVGLPPAKPGERPRYRLIIHERSGQQSFEPDDDDDVPF